MEEKSKNTVITSLVIVIIALFLLLFGKPILNQITTYRENMHAEAELQCAQDDAPYWCDL